MSDEPSGKYRPAFESGAGQPKTGPGGHEWEKTKAANAFVKTMVPRADDPANLRWHGWALHEAFVAGAEWQEKRKS